MSIYRIAIPIQNRPNAVFDMDLDIAASVQDATVAQYLSENRFPEPELIHLLVRAIRPGDHVVDCGACTGFFTLLMGALGASVLAIEPGENNLPALRRNIALNKFDVDVRPVALGEDTADREFVLIDDGGSNSFTQPEDRPPGRIVTVPVRRLSDIVSTKPRLIKMDIEGAEFDALRNWLSWRYRCPYIAVEYNPDTLKRAGRTGSELRNLMSDFGYDMFVLLSDGILPLFVPSNVEVKASRQNTNVLFASAEAVGALWPDLHV